jgi:hypothetical protein
LFAPHESERFMICTRPDPPYSKETILLLPVLAFAAKDESLEQFCSDSVGLT